MALRPLKIDLDAIAECMAAGEHPDCETYLDLQTGELHAVFEEVVEALDNPEFLDELPDWMREQIPVAKAVRADSDRYAAVPTELPGDGWEAMRRFASEVPDEAVRDRLLQAIQGRGAFRRFKDALDDYDELRQRWYAVQEERKRQLAREWLEELGIEAVHSPPSRQPD